MRRYDERYVPFSFAITSPPVSDKILFCRPTSTWMIYGARITKRKDKVKRNKGGSSFAQACFSNTLID